MVKTFAGLRLFAFFDAAETTGVFLNSPVFCSEIFTFL